MSTPNNGAIGSGKVNLPGINSHHRQHRLRNPRFDVERVHPASDPSVSGAFERFRVSRVTGSAPDEQRAFEVSTSPGPVSLPEHLPPISHSKFPRLTAELLAIHDKEKGNTPSGLARKIFRMFEKNRELSSDLKEEYRRIICDQVSKLQPVSGGLVDSAVGSPAKLLVRFKEIKNAKGLLVGLTKFYKSLPAKESITPVTKKRKLKEIEKEHTKAYNILHTQFMREKEGHVPHLPEDLYSSLRQVYEDIRKYFE